MSPTLEDILNLAILILVILGIVSVTRYWQTFRGLIKLTLPFLVLGTILLLATAAGQTLTGEFQDTVFLTTVANAIQLLRNLFLATVGLTLLTTMGLTGTIRPWEEGVGVIRRLPLLFVLTSLLGFGLYTAALFLTLAPAIFDTKLSGFGGYFLSFSYGMFTALNEELLFRMCVIGMAVFVMQSIAKRWAMAILVSSIFWGFAHWFVGDLGWIKVLHTLPLGILLGYTFKRFGFEASIYLHFLTNIVGMAIGQLL